DFTIRTSILEGRRLTGDERLAADLKKRFRDDVMKGTGAQFVAAKLDDLPLFAVSQAQAAVAAPAKAAPSVVEDSLADLDVDGMSPREALEALYRLKGLLKT
ncbi:MAG TPA: hypothetical protein VN157_06605, partial [Caulobacter sp.]|nr:hypothetical protein [Caulobacter sp.]